MSSCLQFTMFPMLDYVTAAQGSDGRSFRDEVVKQVSEDLRVRSYVQYIRYSASVNCNFAVITIVQYKSAFAIPPDPAVGVSGAQDYSACVCKRLLRTVTVACSHFPLHASRQQ